jgi:ketosteroid isomerase-like protein
MSNRSNSEQSKTVVDAYYQAGVEGRLREFARYLHPDFTTTAPNYLPWVASIRARRSSATRSFPTCPTSSTSDGSATTSSWRRTTAWWRW